MGVGVPGTDELVDVPADGLEDGASDHEDRADPDGGPPADTVGEIGGEGVACERTNVLDRICNQTTRQDGRAQQASLTWMAFNKPSVPPWGVPKNVSH